MVHLHAVEPAQEQWSSWRRARKRAGQAFHCTHQHVHARASHIWGASLLAPCTGSYPWLRHCCPPVSLTSAIIVVLAERYRPCLRVHGRRRQVAQHLGSSGRTVPDAAMHWLIVNVIARARQPRGNGHRWDVDCSNSYGSGRDEWDAKVTVLTCFWSKFEWTPVSLKEGGRCIPGSERSDPRS
jgi:hypothetical protein